MRHYFGERQIWSARAQRGLAVALTLGIVGGVAFAAHTVVPAAAWAEAHDAPAGVSAPGDDAALAVGEAGVPDPEPGAQQAPDAETEEDPGAEVPGAPGAEVAAATEPVADATRAPETATQLTGEAPGDRDVPLEGVGGNGAIASSSPGPESAMPAPRMGGGLLAGDLLAGGLLAGGVTAQALKVRGSVLGDDYPARYRNLPWYYPQNYIDQGLIWDEWNFAYRQCTSFVAWRMNNANGIQFSNQYGGLDRWGDAGQWAASAGRLGIKVDTVPEVGTIAWSGPMYAGASGFGHVAWVSQVLGNGDVVIEEYNAGWSGSYGARTVPSTAFQGYIHVADLLTAFRDVAPGHKFFKEIEWMHETGKSTGVRQPSGKPLYLPSAAVSREAMAAFLYRLEAPSDFVAPEVSPFADLNPGDKFYREIAWMYLSGLSTGIKQPTGKPIYAPKEAVSREAMAAFIYRLENAGVAAPAVSPFGDMRPGDKFFREIAWMSSAGLSTGIRQPTGLPHYAPKSSVSREAMAAFLYRLEAGQ